ncbi:hypothetical protein AHAS_Ahas01G0127900 [Arachis hypogaea]
MVDKSLKQAHGIVENVFVKVGELFLPVDFLIPDMEEDENDSLSLGRPFMTIGRALIDVKKGELVLKMREDYLIFKVFKPFHHSDEGGTCMKNELTNPSLQRCLTEVQQSPKLKPPLVGTNKIFPDIQPMFGVGCALSTKERVPNKKVPRGWRKRRFPLRISHPEAGMKVVITKNPILPHIVNRILSLKHIELIHDSTKKKFIVRGDELSPYDHPFPSGS